MPSKVPDISALPADAMEDPLSGLGAGMVPDLSIAEQADTASVWDSLPVGLLLVRAPDGRILRSKETPTHNFGDTVGATLAASVAASPRFRTDGTPIPLDDLPLARALWRGETVPGEVVLRRAKDGSLRETLVSAAPIRGAGGQVAAAIALVQDVTEDRMTKAALAATEGLLLQALEAGRVIAFEWDTATDRVRRSPSARAVHGPGPATAPTGTGKAYLARIHPEDRDGFRAALARMGPEVPQYSARYRLLRADGRTAWMEETGSGAFDAAGRLARVSGLARDVTAEAEAEAALRESEARFRAMADNIPQLAWMARPDGHFFWYNRRWFDFTGTTPAEMEGWGWRKVHHPDHVERVVAYARHVFETGERWEDTFPLRGKDGAYRWFLSRAEPIRDAEGRITLWFGTNTDITDRRETEAALRESETRLRQVLETVGEGFVVLDEAFRVVSINAEGLRMDGRPAAAILGKTHWEVWPASIGTPVEAAYRRAMAERVAVSLEHRYRDEKTDIWLDIRAVPAPGGLALFYRDITERKRAEQAVAESQALLAGVLEAALDPVFLKDPEGRYVVLNDAAVRAIGRRREEIIGRTDAELVPAELAARLRAVDLAVMRSGIPQVVEERLDELGRGPRIFLSSKAPRRAADGTVTGLVGVSRDVTERVAGEAELAASEAHFRALADAMPQLAFTTTPDGQTEFVNRRWLDYTGQNEEQARGTGWVEAMHPEDRERTEASWLATVASGEAYEVEHRLRGADGVHRWFLTRAEPLRDREGQILKWLGTCTDISEIVAARETVARSAEELEQRVAERTRALSDVTRNLEAEMRRREEAQAALIQSQKLEALGQFTGSIAHDFNNVLAAVQGCLRLLERRVGKDPATLDLVGQGVEAARRGARLVGQLMAFARKEEPRPAILDPAALLEGALSMVRHTVGRAVACTFTAAPDTWPVIADPVRLEMVLLNLAANARDAMPRGGRIDISVRNADPAEQPPSLRPGRDRVLIAVSDTGAGMDAGTLRRATEPFFTTKPLGRGTGLGLPSADEFARLSGGTLRLRSAPGQGTTVELFLPRAAVEATPAAPTRADRRHGGARLLVVDDDPGTRTVIAGLLSDLGYTVVQAASAEAAEAAVHGTGGRLDMLVTDVVMEGADGMVLAARLRAERPDLPVLFITGDPGRADPGDAPVLRKPFTDAALAEAVLRGLGRLNEPAGG